jgi:hypothetical protein
LICFDSILGEVAAQLELWDSQAGGTVCQP